MRTANIMPFTEHRQHLREHFEQVKRSNHPLIVTTNGKPAAVVISPERYDQLAEAEERLQSLEMIDKSMQDIQAGRTQPMRDALRQIADEQGVKLER
ncbi:type II toxin-antitoxin system Phd/YefM family antitoxin [Phycisphaerales bacterium AB-hyl4]|uniref:Antitoxin n=1 Tax=Natronomicrosphaera hydrolytica TaxID=3242702 RepID=A0ABV4U916_9BACT